MSSETQERCDSRQTGCYEQLLTNLLVRHAADRYNSAVTVFELVDQLIDSIASCSQLNYVIFDLLCDGITCFPAPDLCWSLVGLAYISNIYL